MAREQGGANTENGATCLLWRKLGLPVTIIPASEESPDNPWPARLAAAGCKIRPVLRQEDLPRQSWLFRSIVVDFCVERAVRSWDTLARLGCKLLHVPTMCKTFQHEHDAFRHRPPTAVVFESEFQRNHLSLQYTAWGAGEDRQAIIRGAFDTTDFPFAPKPHAAGEPFVVGRLGRDVPAKWPRTLWHIMADAREQVSLVGDVMGWTPAMQQFSGVPPKWVQVRPPGFTPVSEYLKGLHALLCIGGCKENWPRVGLEAMAAGVPVIADDSGGWPEMIRHIETGLLCVGPEDTTAAIVMLARHPQTRQRMAEEARTSLAMLADPQIIGDRWLRLFSDLSASAKPPDIS
jgi:hypothetical protein